MVLHDPKQNTSLHPLAWFPCTHLKKLKSTEIDSRISVWVIFVSGSGTGTQDKKLTQEHWCCCCWGFLLFFPSQSSFLYTLENLHPISAIPLSSHSYPCKPHGYPCKPRSFFLAITTVFKVGNYPSWEGYEDEEICLGR